MKQQAFTKDKSTIIKVLSTAVLLDSSRVNKALNNDIYFKTFFLSFYKTNLSGSFAQKYK